MLREKRLLSWRGRVVGRRRSRSVGGRGRRAREGGTLRRGAVVPAPSCLLLGNVLRSSCCDIMVTVTKYTP